MENKGFTLVELSIVLVIIGLLVGGILVAQSMIDSSRLLAFTQQISQYDAALVNFKGKYKSLPGDTTFLSPQGDGDGVIENSEMEAATYAHSTRVQDGEVVNFWPQLQLDGLMMGPNTMSATPNVRYRPGINIPTTNIGNSKTGGIAILPNTGYKYRLYWYICDWSPMVGQSWDASIYRRALLTPTEALAVDKKMDDGLASRLTLTNHPGFIWADNWNNSTATIGDGRCFRTNQINYDPSRSDKECCLAIKAGGDLDF